MERINARNFGDNYQHCHFWDNALGLLNQNDCIEQVSTEYNEFDGFDDVVVHFNQKSPLRAEYQQIKWHTTQEWTIGYEDLIDPKFIRATGKTLLRRLYDAKRNGKSGCRYKFITTARLKEGDPLGELISTKNFELRIDKLKRGKTDRSKMGQVRRCWREHLNLESDDELYDVIENFAVQHGAKSLDEMREAISLKANSVGINLSEFHSKNSGFVFESFTRNMLENKLNSLNKEKLIEFLNENGLSVSPSIVDSNGTKKILIRSFKRAITKKSDFKKDNVLDLLRSFEGRHLLPNLDWNDNIAKWVSKFLVRKIGSAEVLRLTLDAHLSISFVAGATLNLKSGVKTELIQFGQIKEKCWHESDASGKGSPRFNIKHKKMKSGSDIAVAININQPTTKDALKYIMNKKLKVGIFVECEFPSGPSQANVLGGEHAARLSDQVVHYINEIRSEQSIPNGKIHFFIAAPYSFVFYLGQQVEAIGRYQMYEFDLGRNKTGSYSPSVCS